MKKNRIVLKRGILSENLSGSTDEITVSKNKRIYIKRTVKKKK
jgi:hypothetical protein